MNAENIWNQADWVIHARNIIENLDKFPEESRVILILRHSHRNEPKLLENVNKLRLTPQGHAIAKKFGESIPKNRTIRIFHSIIWRCEETAENIHNGFQSIGGISELKGVLEPLYHIGIQNRAFRDQLNYHHFREVLFRWSAGFYLPNDWTPFTEYCQQAAQLIWNQGNNHTNRNIDIYVTHDWHVMSLRYGWFGLPPDEHWVKFLGGFGFTLEDDDNLFLDHQGLRPIEIPHWWKPKT
ncbi:MAG: histidine phosphatase family protein [Candidatus Lokiarchaeota archaeon]|nr:histidine phosphatase family protein [Candidatus Lokiarchaeota archaeon]